MGASSPYNRKNFPGPQHCRRVANLAHRENRRSTSYLIHFAGNFRRVRAQLRKKDDFSGTLTSAALTRHGNGRTWVVTAPGGKATSTWPRNGPALPPRGIQRADPAEDTD